MATRELELTNYRYQIDQKTESIEKTERAMREDSDFWTKTAEENRNLRYKIEAERKATERAYPRLRQTAIDAFERFPDHVQQTEVKKMTDEQWKTTPADLLSLQTEDGTRIDIKRQAPLHPKTKLPTPVFNISYSHGDTEVGINLEIYERKGVDTVDATISFKKADKLFFPGGASLDSRHADSLTGLIDNSTPLPVRQPSR